MDRGVVGSQNGRLLNAVGAQSRWTGSHSKNGVRHLASELAYQAPSQFGEGGLEEASRGGGLRSFLPGGGRRQKVEGLRL